MRETAARPVAVRAGGGGSQFQPTSHKGQQPSTKLHALAHVAVCFPLLVLRRRCFSAPPSHRVYCVIEEVWRPRLPGPPPPSFTTEFFTSASLVVPVSLWD